jgi:hypothetical protein
MRAGSSIGPILKSSYSKLRHPLIPAHVARDNNFWAITPRERGNGSVVGI